jgi:hypothetical protein
MATNIPAEIYKSPANSKRLDHMQISKVEIKAQAGFLLALSNYICKIK